MTVSLLRYNNSKLVTVRKRGKSMHLESNLNSYNKMEYYEYCFSFEIWLAILEQEIDSTYLTFVMEEEQILFMN